MYISYNPFSNAENKKVIYLLVDNKFKFSIADLTEHHTLYIQTDMFKLKFKKPYKRLI